MTNPEPDNTPVPTSFLPQAGDETGVRVLKIVVLTLGLLLMLGMLVMIGRIGYMIANPKPSGQTAITKTAPPTKSSTNTVGPNPTASTASSAQDHNVILPPKGLITAPKSGAVTHMALSGNRLALHYTTPTGPIIVIVDLKTGREVQRLRVQQPQSSSE